jgi:Kef-type K+ transport system membrane component KefB
MRKYPWLYIIVIATFAVGIAIILHFGSRLQTGNLFPGQTAGPLPQATAAPQAELTGFPANLLGRDLYGKIQQPLSLLLLQIIVIILAARGIGALFVKMGQPAVVGEMLAGILLGPSLLGILSPGTEAFLFPSASMNALQLLSQIGVILFMFVVGMELNLQSLRRRAHTAILISHAGILVPFLLGAAFALFIYRSLAPPHVSFAAFSLFMGIAMSITAFPVLARIIKDRGLADSALGNTAMACAAVDDVTAWCILAVVVAVARAQGWGQAVLTIFLALSFTGVMLLVIKPNVQRVVNARGQGESQNRALMAGVLAFALTSAFVTEAIGIHALFGAFLAGVVVPPQESLRAFLRQRLETFSLVVLLPLFFAFTGLRTQVGQLADWHSWLLCAGIVAVAIAGKLGGSTLAARWTGLSWHDSASIGALMNTRGLMELIALTIGYDLGILSSQVFTMLVLMALGTTLMTGPLLSLLGFMRRREATRGPENSEATAAGAQQPPPPPGRGAGPSQPKGEAPAIKSVR